MTRSEQLMIAVTHLRALRLTLSLLERVYLTLWQYWSLIAVTQSCTASRPDTTNDRSQT